VATYIDGVYLPFAHALAQSFVKLERIRGAERSARHSVRPQLTGGAINIITKKPSDQFGASVDVGGGNFNSINTRIFVTGPILDTLKGSLSVIYDKSDPYSKLTADSSFSIPGHGHHPWGQRQARLGTAGRRQRRRECAGD